MALNQMKRIRMANAVLRAVHECDAGMKVGVGYYRHALSRGENALALELLKRAARLPFRVEARIQNLITIYGSPEINTALGLIGTVTLSDLQAELDPLKVYSDTLKTAYQNTTMTAAQIADDIELNRADIDPDEVAPIPVTYVDDM